MGDTVYHLIEAAAARGQHMLANTTLARTANFDATRQMLCLSLSNDCNADIPVALIEGLAEASDADRALIEISPTGYGLHWPTLDLDLSVPGLLAVVFGTQNWMNRQRAAVAGAATSPAKSAAAQRNGVKGGRPRKITTIPGA